MLHDLWMELTSHPALILLSLFFMALLSSTRRLPWLFFWLTLPDTLAHEFSHWLVALLLQGHPQLPRLGPRSQGQRWILGSVRCQHLRFYNAIPIALAPLLWLLVLPLLLKEAPPPSLHLRFFLWSAAISQCLLAAWPSLEDWKLAWHSGWPSLALGLILIAIYLLIFRGNFHPNLTTLYLELRPNEVGHFRMV